MIRYTRPKPRGSANIKFPLHWMTALAIFAYAQQWISHLVSQHKTISNASQPTPDSLMFNRALCFASQYINDAKGFSSHMSLDAICFEDTIEDHPLSEYLHSEVTESDYTSIGCSWWSNIFFKKGLLQLCFRIIRFVGLLSYPRRYLYLVCLSLENSIYNPHTTVHAILCIQLVALQRLDRPLIDSQHTALTTIKFQFLHCNS